MKELEGKRLLLLGGFNQACDIIVRAPCSIMEDGNVDSVERAPFYHYEKLSFPSGMCSQSF